MYCFSFTNSKDWSSRHYPHRWWQENHVCLRNMWEIVSLCFFVFRARSSPHSLFAMSIVVLYPSIPQLLTWQVIPLEQPNRVLYRCLLSCTKRRFTLPETADCACTAGAWLCRCLSYNRSGFSPGRLGSLAYSKRDSHPWTEYAVGTRIHVLSRIFWLLMRGCVLEISEKQKASSLWREVSACAPRGWQ